MIPSPFQLRALLGLGLLALGAPAQEQFLQLEPQRSSAVFTAPQEQRPTAAADAFADLPSLAFANREAILLAYEQSVQTIAGLSKQPLSRQDAETGTEIQGPDLATTRLGTAGGFFSATLGVKSMQDKEEWKPLESQGAASIEFAWKLPRSAFAGVAGLAGSYSRQNLDNSVFNGEIDTWVVELYLGGKAYLEIPKSALWGYVGGGVSFLYTEVEALKNIAPNQVNGSSDWGVGAYAQLGLLLRLNRSQSIGIEYRGLFGTNTSFFNNDVAVDYNEFNFVFLVAF